MTKVAAIALGLALMSLLETSNANAEQLTFAHGFNDNHYWSTQLVKPWTKCVQEVTKDEITFLEFPSGQIVGHADALHGLNSGLTTISPVAVGYETDKLPLNGIAMLPGMGEGSRRMATAYRQMLSEGSPMYEEFTAQRVGALIVSLLAV